MFAIDELLENVFAEKVDGIDAILTTNTRSVSFTIKNGAVEFVGEGRHADEKYQPQEQSIDLIEEELYYNPHSFQFTLIPNDDFYAVYQTSNPGIATLAIVMSILLATIVFFVHDYLVRREFQAKKDLLDARRQFMVRGNGSYSWLRINIGMVHSSHSW